MMRDIKIKIGGASGEATQHIQTVIHAESAESPDFETLKHGILALRSALHAEVTLAAEDRRRLERQIEAMLEETGNRGASALDAIRSAALAAKALVAKIGPASAAIANALADLSRLLGLA